MFKDESRTLRQAIGNSRCRSLAPSGSSFSFWPLNLSPFLSCFIHIFSSFFISFFLFLSLSVSLFLSLPPTCRSPPLSVSLPFSVSISPSLPSSGGPCRLLQRTRRRGPTLPSRGVLAEGPENWGEQAILGIWGVSFRNVAVSRFS